MSKKKIWLKVGAIAIGATPLVALISCGDEVIKDKMSWNRSDKKLILNLNGLSKKVNKLAFSPYGLDTKGLIKISQDFEKVIVQNNISKIKNDDIVTVEFMTKYEDTIKATKDGAYAEDHDVEVGKELSFKFKYQDKAQNPKLEKKEWGELKTNFLESMLEALKNGGFIASQITIGATPDIGTNIVFGTITKKIIDDFSSKQKSVIDIKK